MKGYPMSGEIILDQSGKISKLKKRLIESSGVGGLLSFTIVSSRRSPSISRR